MEQAQSLEIRRFDFGGLTDFMVPTIVHQEEEPIAEAEETPPPPPAATFTEADMEAAREKAYQQGLEAGKAEVHSEQVALQHERDLAAQQQMAALSAQLQDAMDNVDALLQTHEQDIVQMAYAVAVKLAGASLAHDPFPVLQSMIAECLPAIIDQPNLHVRVHPDAVLKVKEMLHSALSGHSYEGRYVVKADDTLASGDIIIRWQSGEVGRLMDKMMQDINRHLPAPNPVWIEQHTPQVSPSSVASVIPRPTAQDSESISLAPSSIAAKPEKAETQDSTEISPPPTKQVTDTDKHKTLDDIRASLKQRKAT